MRRLLTVLLVACATLAVAVAPALAHNVLTGSDPKDGARLASLPGRATLTFDQPVRADFAHMALTGPDGTVAKLSVEVVDTKVMAALPVPGVAGVYIIGYQIVSNDGHPVSGKITFTVTGPAGQTPATTPPTAAPSASDGAAPPPATGPGSRSLSTAQVPASGGGWVWGLLVVALLLSGLGILVVARHGRPARGSGA
ncbi:copper resistance CopC family protein [Sphaerisporangium perillae]|uniref:copper resistance CopC family protein n=1 Tax=Sphaerisporangium perillae TaxID=2935860 RepID=UPI00200DD6A9|nr:copper resistance CopC family protein [Sphaerisporangium perillae]